MKIGFSAVDLMRFLTFLCGMLFGLSCGPTLADSDFDIRKLSSEEERRFLTVSNFSAITYGANLLCKDVSASQKKRVEELVTEIYAKFPELKALVDDSPYFENARASNRAFLEKNMKNKPPEEYEAACAQMGNQLRSYIDHGRSMFEKWAAVLRGA
jgi:hypothetical protein